MRLRLSRHTSRGAQELLCSHALQRNIRLPEYGSRSRQCLFLPSHGQADRAEVSYTPARASASTDPAARHAQSTLSVSPHPSRRKLQTWPASRVGCVPLHTSGAAFDRVKTRADKLDKACKRFISTDGHSGYAPDSPLADLCAKQAAVAESSRISSPGLLVKAAEVVRTFPEAEKVIVLLHRHAGTLDANSSALASLHLISSTCQEMEAVHLLPALTELILALVERIVTDDAQPSLLVQEMLIVYAFRLVRYPHYNARQSAIAILKWLHHNRFTGLFSKILTIFCGTVFQDSPTLMVGYTASVPFEVGAASYHWRFWNEDMWQELRPILEDMYEISDVLIVLSAMIRSAGQLGAMEKAREYFALAEQLYKRENGSSEAWDSVVSQYYCETVRRQPKRPGGSVMDTLRAACQHLGVAGLSEAHGGFLSSFLHSASLNSSIPPSTLVDLLSSSEAGGYSSSPGPPYSPHPHITIPASLLGKPHLYEALVAGFTRRPRNDYVAKAIRDVWALQMSRNLGGGRRTLDSWIRIAIAATQWTALSHILRCCCVTEQEHAAVNELEELLAPHVLATPLHNSDVWNMLDWHLEALDAQAFTTFRKRGLSKLLVSTQALEGQIECQANVLYQMWRLAPRIFPSPPHTPSVVHLLVVAHLSLKRSGLHSETQIPLWDGVPAPIQARAIFREILFSQHPQLLSQDLMEPLFRSAAVHPDWRRYRHFASKKWESLLDKQCDVNSTRSLRPCSQDNSNIASASDDGSALLGRRISRASAEDSATENGLLASADEPEKAPHNEDAPSLKWSTVVFSDRLFQLYMSLITSSRFLGKPTSPEPWQEPLVVLAWHRQLGVRPTKQTLCDAIVAIEDSLSSPFPSDEEAPASFGPLTSWIAEWIPLDHLPSQSDVWHRRQEILSDVSVSSVRS